MRLTVARLRRVIKRDFSIQFGREQLTSYGGLELLRRFLVLIGLKVRIQSLRPIRLDALEALAIDSRRTAIGLAALVGECQHVFPVHLVVQCIETEAGRFLRFCV